VVGCGEYSNWWCLMVCVVIVLEVFIHCDDGDTR